MKILHVITKRQLRGAEIFAYQLGCEFIRSGHQVKIVALQSPASFPELNQIEYEDLNLKKNARFTAFASWKRFSDIVQVWKPDIIQANASETLMFTVISRLLFGWRTPLIYRNANKAGDFIKSSLSRIWNKWLANQVDFVISVSENCRLDYIQTFNIPESKTKTIPIGTKITEQNDAEDKDTALPFPYYINVASLVPEKNHAGLLSIYSRYKNTGGKIALVIVGDGREKDHLMKLTKSLGIADWVYFLGYRKDATSLMKKAEALLLPSFIEGLPGVILEAMASKIPVVAYNIGGIPEVIQDGTTGALIDKGNEGQFVTCMNVLETDMKLREKIIASAFSLCKIHYSIDAIADRFLNQYTTVIHAKN